MKRKEYLKPNLQFIKMLGEENFCGIKASHNDYSSENWNEESGITGGHSDYDSETWGDDGDGIRSGHSDYGYSNWGED